MKKIIVVLIMLCVQNNYEVRDYKICGIAIDNNKNLVAHAQVTLVELGTDDLEAEQENSYFRTESDENGNFCIDLPKYTFKKSKVIFLTGPIKNNAVNLVAPHTSLTKQIKPYQVDEGFTKLPKFCPN